ncbi:hypothetical protein D3C78_1407630 [compost metagenome]
MPGTRQRPELTSALEHSGRFQLVAGDFGEVAVELQYLTRLHGVIALRDHRQRCLGVRTEEHLLFGEGVDCAQVARDL